jgi:hypothetical protein
MVTTSTVRDALVVPTSIAAVTVHRNGALVVRRGEVLRAGDVEVRGLPLLFSSDTLRVRPEHGAVANLEETVRLESKPAPLPPSEEEREKLLLAIGRVDDELHVVDVMLEALRASHPELLESKSLEPKLVDARAWIEVLAVSRNEGAALAKRRLALAQKRRDLEHERVKLDERTRSLVSPEAPRVLRGVRFTVDAPGQFALEYFVHAARWVPTYALHLTSPRATDAKPATHARLVSAALVAQASGEDWSNAQLSVSTVDLARETTLPTLSSWRIGRAQPATARGFRALPSDLPTLFAGYDRGPRRPSLPPSSTPATTIAAPQNQPRPPIGAIGEITSARGGRAAQPDSTVEGNAQVRFDPSTGALLDDDEDSFAEEDASGEAREFERERSSNARPSLPSSLAFEQAVTDPDGYDIADLSDAPKSMPMPSRAPAPGMAMPPMPMAGAPLAAKSGAMFSQALSGFGGGGGGGAARHDEGGVVRAQSELPPRWRTASMRMAAPDEGQRGSLLPLDPIARLSWLLEAHDVDGMGRAELRRAVTALQEAQRRMEQSPLPRGTSLLLGTSLQAVMRASAATDVPGDGTFYRVEVRVDEGAGVVEHRCVPRSSNDVWRTCHLDVKAALPPGPLAVYEDGAFKVNARLDMQPNKPGVDVNLGVDPDVRVMARTVHLRQAEKGLMSQTSRVEHDVDVEVRNTRKEPARVIVHDRLPVPADNVKDVVVQVIEEKPPIARTDKDAAGHDVKGAFEWRVSIMPGDTQKLVLKYAIDLPAKAELEGGNRRE